MNYTALISALFLTALLVWLFSQPQKHEIVLIGDSHLVAMKPHLDTAYTVVAKNGLTFRAALNLNIPKAKGYVFVLGTNDVYNSFEEAVFRRHVADLVGKCPQDANVSFVQVPQHIPNSEDANQVLAEFGSLKSLSPFWGAKKSNDGIHFTLQAYKEIAQEL